MYLLCIVKKFTVFLLLIAYSVATFGVNVNYFYCCGKLKEVQVKLESPKHHNCSMKENKNCCDNKTVTLKINDEQQHSPVFLFKSLDLTQEAVHSFTYNQQQPIGLHVETSYSNRPPPLTAERCILFSVFRI